MNHFGHAETFCRLQALREQITGDEPRAGAFGQRSQYDSNGT
jgi:hypothetical protein